MEKLICITGPTATGKTRLGVELSKIFGGEVVSCDSMQVYRGMDIGTAKATEDEMCGIRHHMLSVAEPGEKYSAARYVAEATACIDDIFRRGKTPIVVGGTGLYMDSLVRGVEFAEQPENETLRRELSKIAEQEGGERLLEILREFDPYSAGKLHPNNTKRIIRAIEVYKLTGKTITQHDEESRLLPDAFEPVRLVLSYRDREKLYRRIDERVDLMLERGLENEVRSLLSSGLSKSGTAMAAIGYKEMAAYIRGKCTLDEAAESIKQGSRRYAKRQLTWFRRYEDAKWIYVDECDDFARVRQIATDFIEQKMR